MIAFLLSLIVAAQASVSRAEVRSSLDRRTRIAAGGWTGSGGGGLACFADAKTAENAVDESGRLKPEMRPLVTRVILLDLWEMGVQYGWEAPRQAEDANAYLTRVLDAHLSADMPYFLAKLRDALKVVGVNWEDQGALPLILDAGDLERPVPADCRLVQLVIRYVKSDPGHRPEIFIDVDRDLISRMENGPSWADSRLFGAGLRLHEALWTVGVEFGMPDSKPARQLTAGLMSMNIAGAIAIRPIETRKGLWISYLYGLGFRDFFSLFWKEEPAVHVPTPVGSKSSRRIARADLAKIYRAQLAEMGISQTGKMDPAREDEFLQKLVARLTVEQNFIFNAESVRNGGKVPFNTDVLYLDGINDEPHVKYLCDTSRALLAFVDGGGDNIKRGYEMSLRKSLLYCPRE